MFPDLGSHLLDWTLFLFGRPERPPEIWRQNKFENKSSDHCAFGFRGSAPELDFEMTPPFLAQHVSLRHLRGTRERPHRLPLQMGPPAPSPCGTGFCRAGRPTEESQTLVCPDPTWHAEYEHFRALCRNPATNLDNDIWINGIFNAVRNA